MLSIGDIKRKTFTAQKGGKFYDISEVDSFFAGVNETLDAITGAYEKAKRDNEELINKIKVLSNKVEEYRSDEDNLRSALLIAQRAADSVVREAKAEAEKILEEAKAEADGKINSVKDEIDSYVGNKKEEADAYLESAKKEYNDIVGKAEGDAESVRENAKKEAEEILAKAKAKAGNLSESADKTVAAAQEKLGSMARITSDFKSSVIDIMNRQIKLLESIEIDEELLEVPEVSEVYHPEYTSEEYNSDDTAEEPATEADEEIQEEAVDIIEEEIDEVVEEPANEEAILTEDIETVDDIETEDIETDDYFEEISSDSEDNETTPDDEPLTTKDEENAQSEQDYFDSLMASFSSGETEKKPVRTSVFTPIMDSDNEEEAMSEEDEKNLKFGRDYDIFGEDEDDSQGSFFGRFKKK